VNSTSHVRILRQRPLGHRETRFSDARQDKSSPKQAWRLLIQALNFKSFRDSSYLRGPTLLGGSRRTNKLALPSQPHSLCITEAQVALISWPFRATSPQEQSSARTMLSLVRTEFEKLGLTGIWPWKLPSRTHSLPRKGPSKFDFPSTENGFPHIRRT
jgi:hypothetical protein